MIFEVTDNVVSTVVSKNKDNLSDLSAARTTTMTCFALPDELIFVDCSAILKDAQRFRYHMENRFQKETTHLLLTHTHWDHCFAMQAFEDVNIVASPQGVQSIKRQIKSQKGSNRKVPKKYANDPELKESYENAVLQIPDISKDELTLGPEDQKILFRRTGGHSSDSAFVYSQSEKTLCTGDNLLTWYAQLVGNGKKMLETYHYWESLDIINVIPGHGNVVGKDYITRVRTYFEELISVLKELKTQGLRIEEVLTHKRLPEYFGRTQEEWIEGSQYHTGWLNLGIKYWYKNLEI